MAKSNKHNRRAKKLKARKATQGSVISNYHNPMSSAYSKLAHAGLYGADCVIDLTGGMPRTFIKCDDTWIEDDMARRSTGQGNTYFNPLMGTKSYEQSEKNLK